jgi:hypothetical protein
MWRKALLLAALAAIGGAPAPDPAVLAGDAGRLLNAQRHGVTGFTVTYQYREHGPAHEVEHSAQASVVRDDGTVVKMRTFGEPSTKPTLVEDDYHLPIERKYLDEYRFAAGSGTCKRCPASAIAVDFVSVRRDDEHGDGTMWIDGELHRVLELDFHPSVLPPRTDSADVTVEFGPVLPDLWDVTVAEQQYNGHTLFFRGWGHVRQRQSNYRRYASISDALTALSAASPAAQSPATPRTQPPP